LRGLGAPTSSGIASPGVLAPSSATTPGAPFAAMRSRDHAAEGKGRQTPAGAVLRVLAPLDGSGRARGTHELLAEPAVRRGTPTLRGLLSCRSRPWSRPSELSLLEEPYPLSRASASLRVRVRPPNGAARSEVFATPFAAAPTSRRNGPEGSLDWKVGTTGPRSRSGIARGALPRSSRRLVSDRPGSPDSAADTPASKLCSPRESVLTSDRRSGQSAIAWSVLSWASSL